MIDEVTIENIALIKNASLVFEDGLTVLTGETGAGKTALLEGIKLLLGERANSDLVREGMSHLLVQGRFFTSDDDLEGTVVRRRVGSDGRSRVTINGNLSTVGELSDLLSECVDLVGQHEHQRLIKPSCHLQILDEWIGETLFDLKDAYKSAFDAYSNAKNELLKLQEAQKRSVEMQDEAHFTLSRIEQVNPQPGEYEELESVLTKMENAEELAQSTYEALENIDSERGAVSLITEAAESLTRAGAHDEELLKLANTLLDALPILEDASYELSTYQDEIDFDPQKLEEIQNRYGDFNTLLRFYGPRMEDVFDTWERVQNEVESIEATPEKERELKQEVQKTEQKLQHIAQEISKIRKKEARNFSKEIQIYLDELEMRGASVECSVVLKPFDMWTKESADDVEFLYQPAEGVSAKPLSKIASGGEMSRVMLAIKASLGEKDSTQTLIFDEVDAGIGGNVAIAVGEVLARLAKTHQVICVTHLAQVAAFAKQHYIVKKTTSSTGEVSTQVKQVVDKERELEIARMLSGSASKTSLKHAGELLQNPSGGMDL